MNLLYAIVWDPPTGIDLGFIELKLYSLCFVVAFLLGVWLIGRMYKNDGVTEDPGGADLMLWVFLATLIGARLGHCMFYEWYYYKDHLVEMILPVRFYPKFEITGYHGLASHGAAVMIPAVAYFYAKKIVKRPFLWVMDRIVIAVALGGAFVRFGNLINSEIIGLPTGSSYGIIFKALGEDFPRHPAQLYEAFSYLLIFAATYTMYKKEMSKTPGMIFGCFLVLLFGVRFIVEYFKENQEMFEDAMFINMGQALSLPFIIAGITLLVCLTIKKNKNEKN